MNIRDKILVVEDERSITNFLRTILVSNDYDVIISRSGAEAYSMITSHCPDLIVLDLGLPDIDGLQIIKSVREWTLLPIVVVSARAHERDKVEALDLGADDYITKPFSPREVVARIKAVLRRIHEQRDEKKNTELRIDNLEINMASFTVKLDGQVVPCTPKEIEIIWCLASNPGLVFSREHLLQSIWGYDFLGDTRAVDSHIKRIRAKLCRDTNHWDIKTVWGVGYRFEMVS